VNNYSIVLFLRITVHKSIIRRLESAGNRVTLSQTQHSSLRELNLSPLTEPLTIARPYTQGFLLSSYCGSVQCYSQETSLLYCSLELSSMAKRPAYKCTIIESNKEQARETAALTPTTRNNPGLFNCLSEAS
jgi:hypothetical protein